jgi:DNA-binding transcriptional ArsR family regulator
MQEIVQLLSALANEKRLRVLDWLKDPVEHFPPQVDGDLVKDGVCGLLIARKLRISQPTTSRHMNLLLDAELVGARRIGKWTFYKRDVRGIARAKRMIGKGL